MPYAVVMSRASKSRVVSLPYLTSSAICVSAAKPTPSLRLTISLAPANEVVVIRGSRSPVRGSARATSLP